MHIMILLYWWLLNNNKPISINCQWCILRIGLIYIRKYFRNTNSFFNNASFSEEPTKAPSIKNGSCPDDFRGVSPWLKQESYCYLPVSERKTWREARFHCANQDFSATLVSIHSESENKFVHENMPGQSSWSNMAWIGLYRDSKGNTILH